MIKYKVGIAGYGVVGRTRHKCIESHPDMQLVAVCDQVESNMTDLSPGIRCYDNYLDLLKDDLDILIVCMTNDVAPDVCIAGLRKGLHIFCEKPPGRDLKDIKKVIEVEKNNPSLKLMYGFNHRFHDSVQEAMTILKSGKMGRIINLKGIYGKSRLITFNQTDWRTKRNVAGGGVLLDQGIHMLDLMRLFAGEFTEISSFVSNNFWGFDVEDNAYALMKTEDGIIGMIHSSATQWRHRFNLDINLERGTLILGGILSGSKSYGSETLTIIDANPDEDKGDPTKVKKSFNKDPSWDREIELFVDSIKSNSKVKSGSSLDAFNTMKLVNKIYYNDTLWRERYEIFDPDRV